MKTINMCLFIIAGLLFHSLAAMPLYAGGCTCSQRIPGHPADTICAVGHRGAAGLRPENTMAAFARAIELGVDAIELDVLMSADNALVVHHDFSLHPETTRKADGERLKDRTMTQINRLTLKKLQTFDVGRLKPNSRYASKYPDQVPSDGERIPLLRDVIQLVKNSSRECLQLWIEIKTSPEEPDKTPAPEIVVQNVVALLKSENFTRRAKILSFDWRSLIHVQTIAPSIPTVYLTSDTKQFKAASFMNPWESDWTAGFDIGKHAGSIPETIRAAGGSWWAPKHTQLKAKQVKEAHRLGICIAVWTPSSKRTMQKMIEMGVDAVITNRPDFLITAIRRKR